MVIASIFKDAKLNVRESLREHIRSFERADHIRSSLCGFQVKT